MKKKVPVRGRTPSVSLSRVPAHTIWDLVVIDPGAVRIVGRDEHPRIALWSVRGKALSTQAGLARDLPLAQGYAEATQVGAGTPDEIRVSHADLVAAVQAIAGDAVRVSVGPSQEANALAQRLLDAMEPLGESAKVDAFLAFLRAPTELVETFARHALGLGATKPWAIVANDADALLVHTPGLGPSPSTVVITGQLEESYAALVFDSESDFDAFLWTPASEAQRTAPGAPFYAISFEPRDALQPEIVARLKRAKYPVPGRGFVPLPLLTEHYATPSPVTPGALLRLTVIADALQKFFKQHRDTIFDDPDASIRFEGSTLVQGTTRPWTVVFPAVAREDDSPPEALTDLDAIVAWTTVFSARHPEALRAAQREIARAHRGRAVSPHEVEADSLYATSLAAHWAATARRLPEGRHPLDIAEAMDELHPEIARAIPLLRRQRVLLGEVIDVEDDVVVVQDLLGGGRYTVVSVPPAQTAQLRRWYYVLAQIVPVDDGRWTYLSVLTGQERFVPDLVPALDRALRAELRTPHPDAPAHEGDLGALLQAEFGIAQAVFRRLGDEARARPRPMYLENTDGDRVELVSLTLRLPGSRATIVSTLEAMPELVRSNEDSWSWLDKSRREVFAAGESIAGIDLRTPGCVVSANSPARAARIVGLLRARFGDGVVELRREVAAPWQKDPNIVAEKGDGVAVRVIANGPTQAAEDGAPPRVGELFARHIWRLLDEPIGQLGGVPRELVKTAAGRDAVEQWLREAEALGQPGEDGQVFFDADPLRRALGLPPVGAQ